MDEIKSIRRKYLQDIVQDLLEKEHKAQDSMDNIRHLATLGFPFDQKAAATEALTPDNDLYDKEEWDNFIGNILLIAYKKIFATTHGIDVTDVDIYLQKVDRKNYLQKEITKQRLN